MIMIHYPVLFYSLSVKRTTVSEVNSEAIAP
jgi:hypothetical protein